jgi:hypothetical protein
MCNAEKGYAVQECDATTVQLFTCCMVHKNKKRSITNNTSLFN